MDKSAQMLDRAPTGVAGLDDILDGGLPRKRLYLLQGSPGVGKTTAALQFLLHGVQKGENVLYVTLSESREELQATAAAHGWSLDKVTLYELTSMEETTEGEYTLFHPSEVELNKTTEGMLKVVERIKPTRVVVDSLSELRLLARDPLRYRRQILALKQYFAGRNCTVLLLDDRTGDPSDMQQVESIAHGVIELEQLAPEYGAERRRLLVKKVRGIPYRGGYHDLKIVKGGLRVFPRLVAAEHHEPFPNEVVSSGVVELDELLGGGVARGSSTLILGPVGSGKSSLAMQYAAAAIGRGQRAAFFSFEEGLQSMLMRARGLGLDLQGHIDRGDLLVQQVDPASLSPGEFSQLVREDIDARQSRVVVIDSLNGYLSAMPAEKHLTLHLHELLSYLSQMGVASFLLLAQHGFVGTNMNTPVEISYLSDAVILLRYFESAGEIRQAISVVKKRSGRHERTIREIRLGASGVRVGEPLREFQGVLTGVPVHSGPHDGLLESDGPRL
jgi:circadian clock protein KaiC